MQAGLAERQRLQAAFGTYVDTALAARLLEQRDDVFTGERREVTVMFVDVRDFTPFAGPTPPRTPSPTSMRYSRSWCPLSSMPVEPRCRSSGWTRRPRRLVDAVNTIGVFAGSHNFIAWFESP
jgi:hypothetical protein